MTRRRPTWPELPDGVRRLVEARLGRPVVAWASHDSGYSPGPALTLTAADGERLFVEAADGAVNPDALRFHRREAVIAGSLPAAVPTPRLRWVEEAVLPGEDGQGDVPWVVLAFDVVDGRHPRVPWVRADVDAVARVFTRLAGVTAPAGLPALADRTGFDGWRELAGGTRDAAGLATYDPWVTANLERLAVLEAGWPAAVAGETLLHHDVRGDNVLLTRDGEAVLVDWPHAARGAAFCDLLGWLPALRLEGGPAPEDVLADHPLARAADPDAVTAFGVALAGYFVASSLEPPPPGIPHLRAFQRAQGQVCVAWLAGRLR
ncbi:MAG TPA: aminoglycoside phosphotransferase [Micrococcales bacterium]|uniref:aminoglycoside phosphotransferase family protein n=1 Tax=Miniimonas arenae TaxID=676201 RepID=UPI000EC162AE|nr:aminoglycoside phosphotransferase family protein [Miniimonas arenae]HCX85729.1 aminoglycoside phosphotransferase [Micrococcales bacterium]